MNPPNQRRLGTIIAGAASNPRRHPIGTNKPSTSAAGDRPLPHTAPPKLLAQVEHAAALRGYHASPGRRVTPKLSQTRGVGAARGRASVRSHNSANARTRSLALPRDKVCRSRGAIGLRVRRDVLELLKDGHQTRASGFSQSCAFDHERSDLTCVCEHLEAQAKRIPRRLIMARWILQAALYIGNRPLIDVSGSCSPWTLTISLMPHIQSETRLHSDRHRSAQNTVNTLRW